MPEGRLTPHTPGTDWWSVGVGRIGVAIPSPSPPPGKDTVHKHAGEAEYLPPRWDLQARWVGGSDRD